MMTKDEALRGLTIGDCRTRREAVKTVKELLNREVEPRYNSIKSELKPCDDAISRQTVLATMRKNHRSGGRDIDGDYIEGDYRERLYDDIISIPPVNPQPSGDLISRQSAIFLASDLKQDLPDDERIADMVMAHNEGILEYQTQLSLLPSVTPQPKTGHWIPVSEKLPEAGKEVLTCSNGGFIEIQSLEESYGGYWENQKGDWTDLEEIIAWMPLPAPFEPHERSEV